MVVVVGCKRKQPFLLSNYMKEKTIYPFFKNLSWKEIDVIHLKMPLKKKQCQSIK
jgi:hypothetical protein